MFRIVVTPEAAVDLQELSAFDRRKVATAIDSQLAHQALLETRNRKRLRPNPLSQWELRVGSHRIFYDVQEDDNVVTVVAVGCKKGGTLYLRGREVSLEPRRDDSADQNPEQKTGGTEATTDENRDNSS